MKLEPMTKVTLALALLMTGTGGLAAQDDPLPEAMRVKIEDLQLLEPPVIRGEPVAAVRLITEAYSERDFRPAWNRPGAAASLLDAIRRADEMGLDPADYHLAALEQLMTQAGAAPAVGATTGAIPDLVTDLDILLTDSLARLAYHMRFGRVDPSDLDANWNLTQDFGDVDPLVLFGAWLDSPDLAVELRALEPQVEIYRDLKAALAEYRRFQEAGGWPAVPPGPVLKEGMRDDRVARLRERLVVTGDLAAAGADPSSYDGSLEEAVRGFQRRHFLDADGKVGPQTLLELNVPVEARVDQIRVNLERARWILPAVPAEYLIVDIAGFRLFLIRNDEIVWRTRVQVGTPYRMTPVFRDDVKYLVFNPTWTIPPGILAKDILPAVKKDPGYLARRQIRVLDRNGKPVDEEAIDWSRYSGRGFPYILRQDPGPDNALGRVKFIFPNEHFVYLHDTPSKGLFDRADRTFSSGCIRVEKPFELARVLLADDKKWSLEAIAGLVKSAETKTVFLPEPMPILLMYWTVALLEDGTIGFKRDVYGRDGAVLAALEEEFKGPSRKVLERQRY
jgi:murein L,D-transpeptidase YcbB/YkuD